MLLNKDFTYLVYGLGVTGYAAARFMLANGYKHYVTDDNSGKLNAYDCNEGHKISNINVSFLDKIDVIILSPGVKLFGDNVCDFIKEAKKRNKKIISDIDIFLELISIKQDKTTIAITGTDGKSTTSALLEHILNQNGCKAIACGNIGKAVLDINIDDYTHFIVETSSQQASIMQNDSKFDYATIINIANDHLDYHGTMEEYSKAKGKLLNVNKACSISIDDEWCDYLANRRKGNNLARFSILQILDFGFSFVDNALYINSEKMADNLIFTNLPGKHNTQNILAALSVCKLMNLDISKCINSIRSFHGLPHRIEKVLQINNITFINDSKATNPHAASVALDIFESIFLIAGGKAKDEGFMSIKDHLKNIKKVFLIGIDTTDLQDELSELKIDYTVCGVMYNAVAEAFNKARIDNEKVTILLSPLCASTDQYKNFEERGNDFKNIVKYLTERL